jgi:hypothetical protein
MQAANLKHCTRSYVLLVSYEYSSGNWIPTLLLRVQLTFISPVLVPTARWAPLGENVTARAGTPMLTLACVGHEARRSLQTMASEHTSIAKYTKFTETARILLERQVGCLLLLCHAGNLCLPDTPGSGVGGVWGTATQDWSLLKSMQLTISWRRFAFHRNTLALSHTVANLWGFLGWKAIPYTSPVWPWTSTSGT